jgi:hypothetical protein
MRIQVTARRLEVSVDDGKHDGPGLGPLVGAGLGALAATLFGKGRVDAVRPGCGDADCSACAEPPSSPAPSSPPVGGNPAPAAGDAEAQPG